jgi:Flp pilus assembly protein TadD
MDCHPQEHRSELSVCGLRRQTVETLAVCGFLLLIVAVVFGQTVQYPFVNFDDNKYISANANVSRGLTTSGIVSAFTQAHNANWIPLTWLSLMVDCQLYDLHAGGYHLTNVLLHAATAMLLFLVLRRMTDRVWPSALVAALFAVHPLRVESVAWVTERKDVLSGLFFMLTLWAYVDYVRHRFSLARYALLIGLFALGILAKPMLVTLPFVLFLLDYWPLGRLGEPCWSCRRLVIEKIPLFVLAAGDCLVTILIQDDALVSSEHLPLLWRLGNAAITYVTYLGQFFYPVGLVVVYPRPGLDLPLWQIGAACLVLVTLTTAAFLGRRRCPYLLVGWLWYLGMLVPVIGLLQVGCTSMADRFTYLSQIGPTIALVWGAADLCRSWPYRRWACGVASGLAITLLAGCAWQQTSYWRDSETLWNRALDCTTRNSWAHYNLGVTLMERGRSDEALKHFQETVNIQPRSPDALNNIGIVLGERGRLDEAVAHFRKALGYAPDCVDSHNNLANALKLQGKIAEAVRHWREVVRLQPTNIGAVNRLAWASATAPEASVRNGAEAVTLARWAVMLSHGREPNILRTLAAAYAENGQFPQAVQTAHQALDLAAQRKQQPLAQSLKTQLSCYESGRPFRDPAVATSP